MDQTVTAQHSSGECVISAFAAAGAYSWVDIYAGISDTDQCAAALADTMGFPVIRILRKRVENVGCGFCG